MLYSYSYFFNNNIFPAILLTLINLFINYFISKLTNKYNMKELIFFVPMQQFVNNLFIN